MSKSVKPYTWRPDLPDHRDYIYASKKITVPVAVDMRASCPPVYDQGQLGSCTGNAIAAAMEYAHHAETGVFLTPSRLFIYYNERALEGTIHYDAGAQIRDGIKTVVAQGVCLEKTWPYNIARFTQRPPAKAYREGLGFQAVSYARVPRDLATMKNCLASKTPFVFGFSVYDAFESDAVASSGILNMPGPDEKMLGGHAVLCVGYDDGTQRFIVRNSWGTSWGQAGYFTMPYAYLLNENLADDFWSIKFTE